MKLNFKRVIFLFCIFLYGFFVPRFLFAQPITEQEVTAVMESESLKQGLINCASSYEHPQNVDLVFIVEESGNAVLEKTEPPVNPNLFSCLQLVMKNAKFRATGKKLEITYPVEFPVTTPGPLPQQPGQAGQVQTQVPPQNQIVVLPPVTSGTGVSGAIQPYAAQAKPAEPDPFWRAQYRSGTSMVIAGAILLPLGGVMIIGSLIGLAAVAADCTFDPVTQKDTCNEDAKDSLTLLAVAGVPVLVVGIVLLAAGSVKKRRAYNRMYYSSLFPELKIAPLSNGSGGVGLLEWHF